MVIVQSVKRRMMSNYVTNNSRYMYNSLNINDIIYRFKYFYNHIKNGEKLTPTIQSIIRTTIIYQQYP